MKNKKFNRKKDGCPFKVHPVSNGVDNAKCTMKAGISLPVEFLSGIGTSTETGFLKETFKDPDLFLSQLKELGISSIEIKSMYSETPPEAVLEAYHKVELYGLNVQMHGYLTKLPVQGDLGDFFPPFTELFSHLRKTGTELVFTVHAYKDQDYTEKENQDRAAAAVKDLGAFFKQENYPVRIALEINRDHGTPDPATTYKEILDILERSGVEEFGICLDMGHTYWNVLHHDLEHPPPEQFLRKVMHTHIHDIGANGTHYPLTKGSVPVKEYITLLEKAGFKGAFTLELACHRFIDETDVRTGYLSSVEILTEILKTFSFGKSSM